uniref:Uncharacterized protein n=3 Tax=Oryza TaxID=4527 RepID=A0A0D3HEV5_9ORYZ
MGYWAMLRDDDVCRCPLLAGHAAMGYDAAASCSSAAATTTKGERQDRRRQGRWRTTCRQPTLT